jgi:hypothetical protein
VSEVYELLDKVEGVNFLEADHIPLTAPNRPDGSTRAQLIRDGNESILVGITIDAHELVEINVDKSSFEIPPPQGGSRR